jgi:nucleoside-diphosphate-sugar epimerase
VLDGRELQSSRLTKETLEVLATATDVVLLHRGAGEEVDGTTLRSTDWRVLANLLESAIVPKLEHLTVVSSAMVYGAWADNPIPLTEAAPIRPNPGVETAADRMRLEERVVAFQATQPAARVCLLRPTLVVSGERGSIDWIARSLWRGQGPASIGDPPRQYLHIDDLARAIEHARRQRLDGEFNVAPEGWLSPELQRQLAGRILGLRPPAGAAEGIAEVRWRLRLSSTPPEILPYTLESWVVSVDKLKGTGWAPMYTNEEAFVVSHREGWWSSLSARRRQEISLGASVAGITAAGVGIASVVRKVVKSAR